MRGKTPSLAGRVGLADQGGGPLARHFVGRLLLDFVVHVVFVELNFVELPYDYFVVCLDDQGPVSFEIAICKCPSFIEPLLGIPLSVTESTKPLKNGLKFNTQF